MLNMGSLDSAAHPQINSIQERREQDDRKKRGQARGPESPSRVCVRRVLLLDRGVVVGSPIAVETRAPRTFFKKGIFKFENKKRFLFSNRNVSAQSRI